jgi:hypothetical protein
MARPIRGDTAKVWFPNMVLDYEACGEHEVNPDSIAESYNAEYDGQSWYADIPQADEQVGADKLAELAKEIQSWMKDDECIETVGRVEYKMDER